MIGLAIDKDDFGPTKYKSIGRGDKGEAGKDDLISRFDIKQNGRHLQRIRTGSGEEALLKPISLLKKLLAAQGKFTIARYFTQGNGFSDVIEFVAGEEGFVEWDEQGWCSSGFDVGGSKFEVRGSGLLASRCRVVELSGCQGYQGFSRKPTCSGNQTTAGGRQPDNGFSGKQP